MAVSDTNRNQILGLAPSKGHTVAELKPSVSSHLPPCAASQGSCPPLFLADLRSRCPAGTPPAVQGNPRLLEPHFEPQTDCAVMS